MNTLEHHPLSTYRERLKRTDFYRDLLNAFQKRERAERGELAGSSSCFVISTLFEEGDRSVLVLTPGEKEAANMETEFRELYDQPAHHLPAATSPATGGDRAERQAHAEQSGRLSKLLQVRDQAGSTSSNSRIWICSILSLLQVVPDPASLQRKRITRTCGDDLDREQLTEQLENRDYHRTERVAGRGEYSVRGGIIDLFPEGVEKPVRIELFGDQIDSIRQFDPGAQRTADIRESISFLLADRSELSDGSRIEPGEPSLLDILPDDLTVFGRSPSRIDQKVHDLRNRHDADIRSRFLDISIHPAFENRITFEPAPLEERPGMNAGTGTAPSPGDAESDLRDYLGTMEQEVKNPVMICRTEGERERLRSLAEEVEAHEWTFLDGYLEGGFLWPGIETAFVSRGQAEGRSGYGTAETTKAGTRPIEDMVNLELGDYVVHVDHGIARYSGVVEREENGTTKEYMKLRFKGSSTVEVPETQFHRVHRYLGSRSGNPSLSRLYSDRWEKKKENVAEAVRELGKEMLRLRAVREEEVGHACQPDTKWQKEFEDAFPHKETPDQEEITRELKQKMESPQPMDLLLTGDVGFGKTELAMRAAFKMIMDGKQVALLAPTTVLVEQHFRTFTDRMGPYPVEIRALNRFRSRSRQKTIIDGMKSGSVDLVIGTHRLLSEDIGFNDLGLVIIDEEQRFGVEHKQTLRQMRATVDVISMSATPIPRSLHMALLGIRDIATLRSPPGGRKQIQTEVIEYNTSDIKKIIQRERDRDGQVYFLHNRVKTIQKRASAIQELLPEARVEIAHGQMDKNQLQSTMDTFFEGHIDVLVCTTIIESGLDHRNANTLIIENADRFGLADLHQLRGRVGRHHRQAYAYFLKPSDRPLTPEGEERLEAIQEFTELGAGFQVAMRDLEIRGAGRLLGKEQSGHINKVGYDLYCQLLKREVKKLKGEKPTPISSATLRLDVDVSMPEDFAPSKTERIEVYRRFGRCDSENELDSYVEEIKDLYGKKLPDGVRKLIQHNRLRIKATNLGVQSVTEGEDFIKINARTPEVKKVFQDLFGRISEEGEMNKLYLFIDREDKSEREYLHLLIDIFDTAQSEINRDGQERGRKEKKEHAGRSKSHLL